MPIITQIKPQKNKKRVNVYLDDKFAFGLDLENYMKLGLKTGQQLTESEVEKIVTKAEYQKTLDKLLRFTTLRPRSEKEIRDRLQKYKVHKSIHKKLFNRLKRLDLVDDEKFAKWWIEQRLQFKFKSRRELEYELRIKGIDRELINQSLNNSLNQKKEIEMAKKLIEKKKYRWQKLSKVDQKRKMQEFLLRKGFGWDVVREVVGK
jgi:regulatory protein